MIERTNDNKLECLNCGKPFTMPVRPVTIREIRIDKDTPHDIIDDIWCEEDDTL